MDDTTARMIAGNQVEYDADKPLHEIEKDIALTRVRLSATIEALERELAPDRVVERGTYFFRQALQPPSGSSRQQVWAYAIPLALITTGLGWLFLLRQRGSQEEPPFSARHDAGRGERDR